MRMSGDLKVYVTIAWAFPILNINVLHVRFQPCKKNTNVLVRDLLKK